MSGRAGVDFFEPIFPSVRSGCQGYESDVLDSTKEQREAAEVRELYCLDIEVEAEFRHQQKQPMEKSSIQPRLMRSRNQLPHGDSVIQPRSSYSTESSACTVMVLLVARCLLLVASVATVVT